MNAIKKFFEKKKTDTKFKLAGPGKRLDSASSSHKLHKDPHQPQARHPPTAGAQMAGAAALARYEQSARKTDVDWSLQAIRAKARKEMEAEKRLAELQMQESSSHVSGPKAVYLEAPPMLAVQGVYFNYPLLGPDTASYDEMKQRIRDFLYEQLEEDKAVASCLIIHTCNKNKEKVNLCIETICKYLENIISSPTEEKFWKIRQSNKIYQERIASMEGARLFLEAAGFEEQQLPFSEGTDTFWVMREDKKGNIPSLEQLRDTLVSAEPQKPQLDRGVQVLMSMKAAQHTNLPPEFFALTAEELKKEIQDRSEKVERTEMLLTKAMREKLELREIRKYRFSLIRVRFPDGLILQGTFGVYEKFSAVLEFVRESIVHSWRPFFLTLSGGGKVTEEDQSLFDLRLVPAVMFNFEWDSSIQDPNLDDYVFLTEDRMMLHQSVDES